MHRGRAAITAAVTAVCTIAGTALPAAAARTATAAPAAGGIVSRLKHLPGVTYLGRNAYPPSGYTVYELEIRQPVNHSQPDGATFEQHLELYERDLNAPMMMYVSGYFNYTYVSPKDTYLAPATAIVDGNQISVESRFFGDSVPHPTLWKYATAWQEAADEHHVVQVFKSLYRARWLLSGVSKGGEAAIFHDYYYPHPLSAQNPEQDLPPGIPAGPLGQQLMRAVHQWVHQHGNHLLFLYGQDDPWSAERFSVGSGARDSAIFTIAGGNHVSPYTDLPPAQREVFVSTLRRWAGVSTAGSPAQAAASRLPLLSWGHV